MVAWTQPESRSALGVRVHHTVCRCIQCFPQGLGRGGGGMVDVLGLVYLYCSEMNYCTGDVIHPRRHIRVARYHNDVDYDS
jgi:hypothetical protein